MRNGGSAQQCRSRGVFSVACDIVRASAGALGEGRNALCHHKSLRGRPLRSRVVRPGSGQTRNPRSSASGAPAERPGPHGRYGYMAYHSRPRLALAMRESPPDGLLTTRLAT